MRHFYKEYRLLLPRPAFNTRSHLSDKLTSKDSIWLLNCDLAPSWDRPLADVPTLATVNDVFHITQNAYKLKIVLPTY